MIKRIVAASEAGTDHTCYVAKSLGLRFGAKWRWDTIGDDRSGT